MLQRRGAMTSRPSWGVKSPGTRRPPRIRDTARGVHGGEADGPEDIEESSHHPCTAFQISDGKRERATVRFT